MKSTGTIEAGTGLWLSPNDGATNESGYTAVPAGDRNNGGTFGDVGGFGYWWSSTEDYTNTAWYQYMLYSFSYLGSSFGSKVGGFSVRCLRDF